MPVRRYQWSRRGDKIHVDIKQLSRLDRVVHRITDDRRLGRSAGAGFEKAHLPIDDAIRLAYAEVLPDEKEDTTVSFLIWAVAWFGRQWIELGLPRFRGQVDRRHAMTLRLSSMTITTMSRCRFTAQQKAEAFTLCLSKGLSCAAVAQRLGLPNSSLDKCVRLARIDRGDFGPPD